MRNTPLVGGVPSGPTSGPIAPDQVSTPIALDDVATVAEDRILFRLAAGVDEPFTSLRTAWRADAAAIYEASLEGYGAEELRYRFAPTLVRNDAGDDEIVLVHRGGAA